MAKLATSKEAAQHGVETVSDQTLRRFLGYHLKRAFNVFRTDLTQALEPFGLRLLSYSTLVLIVDNPGIRQWQLADALAVERPNLVVIIDELEQRELIVRERVPDDRRANALKATPSGHLLCEEAVKANQAREAELLSELSPKERAALIEALTVIENAGSGGPA
jgi:DNA-binding MarR family transcriptional regulator